MRDSVEYSGLWWLPKNPENKIHGKLIYNPTERTILSLDGAFNAKSRYGENFYEIILGVSSDGKKITLKNCLQTKKNIRHLPQRKEQYATSESAVSVFYVGCHFARKEDIKFTRLSVRYSQLEEWLGERPFDCKESKNEEGLSEHIWKFTMPKAKEIILDKCKITISYGFSMGFGVSITPEFEAHVGISVDVGDEMHIDDFFPIVYHIKNFLSLAVGDEVSILAIKGTNKNLKDCETIQLSYSEEIPKQRLFSSPFLPFQYNAISKRPEYFFQKWFNMVEKSKPTYDLYFGTVYNPHLYPTLTFLSFAQALESYHSRTFDGKTRKSLRTRIKELFRKYGKLFSVFIDNRNKFTRKVVDTRNYYTHYSKHLEKRATKVLDLPFLSDKLRLMLIVILLKEIGFDDDFTELVLRKYMRFTTVKSIYA